MLVSLQSYTLLHFKRKQLLRWNVCQLSEDRNIRNIPSVTKGARETHTHKRAHTAFLIDSTSTKLLSRRPPIHILPFKFLSQKYLHTVERNACMNRYKSSSSSKPARSRLYDCVWNWWDQHIIIRLTYKVTALFIHTPHSMNLGTRQKCNCYLVSD